LRTIGEVITSISCDDLFTCFYGLKEIDLTVYRVLIRKGELRVEDISKIVGKKQNTVYRSLQRLLSHGIVIRKHRSLERGGHYFVYLPRSPEELVEEMKIMLEEWNSRLIEALERFPEEIIMEKKG